MTLATTAAVATKLAWVVVDRRNILAWTGPLLIVTELRLHQAIVPKEKDSKSSLVN